MALHGICGIHRTGKSWLAKSASRKIEVETGIPSTTIDLHHFIRSCFDRQGLKASDDLNLEQRLIAQHCILENTIASLVEVVQDPEITFVCRTPLDYMAYTVQTWKDNADQHTPELRSKYADYLELCVSAINLFSSLTYIPAYPRHAEVLEVQEEGKGRMDTEYRFYLDGTLHSLHRDLSYRFPKVAWHVMPGVELNQRCNYYLNSLGLPL